MQTAKVEETASPFAPLTTEQENSLQDLLDGECPFWQERPSEAKQHSFLIQQALEQAMILAKSVQNEHAAGLDPADARAWKAAANLQRTLDEIDYWTEGSFLIES